LEGIIWVKQDLNVVQHTSLANQWRFL